MKGLRTEPALQHLSADELVNRFAVLAVEQDTCMLENNISGANKLYDRMQNIAMELRSRQGDKRTALLSLFEHPNMQVRVTAAKKTLAVAPEAARKQLEAIVASDWQPYAGDAGMCLWALDEGIFKPT
jgi:hypothetical protein